MSWKLLRIVEEYIALLGFIAFFIKKQENCVNCEDSKTCNISETMIRSPALQLWCFCNSSGNEIGNIKAEEKERICAQGVCRDVKLLTISYFNRLKLFIIKSSWPVGSNFSSKVQWSIWSVSTYICGHHLINFFTLSSLPSNYFPESLTLWNWSQTGRI